MSNFIEQFKDCPKCKSAIYKWRRKCNVCHFRYPEDFENTPGLLCRCPECDQVVPCEKVHNGIAFVYHAVHCGFGHEVTPISVLEIGKAEPNHPPEATVFELESKPQTPRTDALDASISVVTHATMEAMVKHSRQLETECDQLAARCAELEKFLDGIISNAPKCGACAEVLFTGGTMNKHDVGCAERKAKALDWLEHFYQNPGNFTLQFCDSFYRDRGKMPLLEAIESAMKKGGE